MATEVNTTQLRQNSANTSDTLRRNSSTLVDSTSLPHQRRQDLQPAGQSGPVKEAREGNVQQEKLDQTVEELSSLAQGLNRELNFSIDDKSGRTIIKVIDSVTDEVIRQIPSEEVIELAQMIDQHAGLLMDAKV